MSFLDDLKKTINPVQFAIDGFKSVYSTIRGKLPPEEQHKADIELMQVELQVRQSEREHEARMEETYARDLASLREQVKEENKSQDKFISRARYAWFWGLLAVYMANYGIPAVANPLLLAFGREAMPFGEIPWDVHMLVGGLLLGLGYMRSLDKSRVKR